MGADLNLKEALGKLALFADFEAADLDDLLAIAEVVEFSEGERVHTRGENGTGLYVIVEGEVSVCLEDLELAILPRGSFFGEISSLLGEPVVTDIMARSPLLCLLIQPEHIERLLLEHPRVALRMLKTEARRLRDMDEARV
jgi:CRP/FNR family transcriptional regulator